MGSFASSSVSIDIHGAAVTVFGAALDTRNTPTVAQEARTASPG